MTDQPFDRRKTDNQWHLDKKVPISLIGAILIQTASLIGAYYDLRKDIALLQQDAITLHQHDASQSETFREAVHSMQDQMSRLDAKLDRLIERSNK